MNSTRLVLLDNEAVQALLDPRHRRHRAALAVVQAGVSRNLRQRSLRLVVPASVRVEAGWDRGVPGAAGISRLQIDDLVLDGSTADRAAALRTALGVSVADAHLGAALAGSTTTTAVLTSDVDDIRRIAAHLDVPVHVVAL